MSEWASTQDENGNTYYYNQATGETSWQAPPGFQQAGSFAASAACRVRTVACARGTNESTAVAHCRRQIIETRRADWLHLSRLSLAAGGYGGYGQQQAAPQYGQNDGSYDTASGMRRGPAPKATPSGIAAQSGANTGGANYQAGNMVGE